MKRPIIYLFFAMCILLSLLCGCDGQEEAEPLTSAQAVQIVLEDLDMTVEEALPHIHSGTYEGAACYNVYVTVDGKSLQYIVHNTTGEILHIAESNHSH